VSSSDGSALGDDGDLDMRLDLSDSAAVGVVDLAVDGTIIAANAAFADLVGAHDPVGRSLGALLGASPNADSPVPSVAELSSESAEPFDVMVVLPDGRRRYLELRPVERRIAGDEPGLTVTIIDRSIRSEAQAEASRYRAIFEDIEELIGIMDPEGTVLSMNPSAERFFGTDAPIRGLLQFVPSRQAEFVLSEILPSLMAEGRWEGDVVLLRHDGVEVPHHVTLQRHPSEVPDQDYWWAVARDRSMVFRAAQAEALEELNEAKDRFIAGVSHELRTPLTTIRGFADILATRSVPRTELEEFVGIIQREAFSMSAIVEDLLVAARIDVGRVNVTMEDLAVDAIIHDVLRGLPRMDRAVANRAEAGIVVRGDAVRCRQVVRNLVTNALRHGGDEIWIETEHSGDRVLIHVCDDGSGVDAELRDEIFLPYVTRPRNGRRPESVGLGLTVCRQLAHLMDGDVVYSRTDRTAFTLDLPRADRRH
jgi:PAS domain S-box-containing protein